MDLLLRYRLQRPVLGALSTEWTPLGGFHGEDTGTERYWQWKLIRKVAWWAWDSGAATRRGPPPTPTGAEAADGTAGEFTPLGRDGDLRRFGGVGGNPRKVTTVAPSHVEGCGAQGLETLRPLRRLFPDPLRGPVSFSHTPRRAPAARFLRVDSRALSIGRRLSGWGGSSALPPGPHPFASQGGGDRPP